MSSPYTPTPIPTVPPDSGGDAVAIGLLIVTGIVAVAAFIAIRIINWRLNKREKAPRYYRIIHDQERGYYQIQRKKGHDDNWSDFGREYSEVSARETYDELVKAERLRQLPPEAKRPVVVSSEPLPVDPELLEAAAGRVSLVESQDGELALWEDAERSRVARKLTEALDRRYARRLDDAAD